MDTLVTITDTLNTVLDTISNVHETTSDTINSQFDIRTLIITLISSSVLAAIVSGLITFWLKKLEYRNEYFKVIIGKRLFAYDILEKQLLKLETVINDNTGETKYHGVLSKEKEFIFFHNGFKKVFENGRWIDVRTVYINPKVTSSINRKVTSY